MLEASVRLRPETARQQRHRGGVHVHAHRVDAVLHHRVERAGEAGLVHVVLVLADADGLRLDLDQLGQRVLQAPRDRHGAAQGDVEIGELVGRQLRGRVDRGAGLRHHHLGDLEVGHLGGQIDHQPVGLAAGRAVADAHQLDPVLDAQRGQRGEGAVPVVPRLVRIDRVGSDQLAGRVHHRHLDAGAEAGVEPHGGARAGRSRQQQVLQVAREHRDRLGVGLLLEPRQQVGGGGRPHAALPGQAHRVGQPGVGRAPTVGDVEGGLDLGLGRVRLALLVRHVEVEIQHALVAAAQHGEDAVRGHVLEALAEVEIVGELGALSLLALGHLGGEHAIAPFPLAQGTHQLGLLGHALDQDMAGAVERRLGIGHALLAVDELGGLGIGQQRRVGEQRLGQRLQAGLARDLRLGAALGAVGRVQVLQRHLGVGIVDGACQLRRQLALLRDALEHGGAPVLQLAQVAETLLELAQLRVVEPAGRSLR